jgi:DNA-directed RNA polymerase subunit alpha
MEKLALEVAPPKVHLVAAAENYGRFAIEPLERGHASSFGNALRRVLVSSIPGAAVTRVKIGGVIHEFSTIPGVLEDGTQLMLNVKGIRLRSYSERPVTMHLVKQGPGPVRAGDIDAPSTVEIVNPNHYICSIDSSNAVLEIQFTVERGRGQQLADQASGLNIGEIAVDAVFTPVPRVNFIVETVHGADPDSAYERLILEIWTDGTVKPGDALSHAGQILTEHYQRIIAFGQPQPVAELPQPERQLVPAEVYDRSIDELGLSTRTYNSLRRAGITSIGRLLELDERSLNAVRNLGPKGVEEIYERLIAQGYRNPDPASAVVAELVAPEEAGADEAAPAADEEAGEE